MTTVAYRDGVLAADTLLTWGSNRDGFGVKIARRGPVLAGASGCVSRAQAFVDWFKAGMTGKEPDMGDKEDPAFGYIITPDDRFLMLGPHGWEVSRDEYLSFGSGGDFASGAMAMGATAEEAVIVAIKHDTKSGGEITVLRR